MGLANKNSLRMFGGKCTMYFKSRLQFFQKREKSQNSKPCRPGEARRGEPSMAEAELVGWFRFLHFFHARHIPWLIYLDPYGRIESRVAADRTAPRRIRLADTSTRIFLLHAQKANLSKNRKAVCYVTSFPSFHLDSFVARSEVRKRRHDARASWEVQWYPAPIHVTDTNRPIFRFSFRCSRIDACWVWTSFKCELKTDWNL